MNQQGPRIPTMAKPASPLDNMLGSVSGQADLKRAIESAHDLTHVSVQAAEAYLSMVEERGDKAAIEQYGPHFGIMRRTLRAVAGLQTALGADDAGRLCKLGRGVHPDAKPAEPDRPAAGYGEYTLEQIDAEIARMQKVVDGDFLTLPESENGRYMTALKQHREKLLNRPPTT